MLFLLPEPFFTLGLALPPPVRDPKGGVIDETGIRYARQGAYWSFTPVFTVRPGDTFTSLVH